MAGTEKSVRAAHHRKIGFMRDFERLAAGGKHTPAPSFLEQAKARWNKPRAHDEEE
jgi:hypothetical protein